MISLLTDARLSDADPAEIRRLERLEDRAEALRDSETPRVRTRADGSRIDSDTVDQAFLYYSEVVVPARRAVESSGHALSAVSYYLATVRTWAVMLEQPLANGKT